MAVSFASEALAAPVLRSEALDLALPGETRPLLEDVRLSLAPGECVLLEGDTGSGKSTLLRALAGLRGAEARRGRIERDARVVLLLQEVESQLLCTTVGEEVALGARTERLPEALVRQRVGAALEAVGMRGSEGREVDALSAGQKQRVVIAALLALEPGVLLLDEPSSALDPEARRGLARVLQELKRRGAALLIADHAPAELRACVDRGLRIQGGRLRETANPQAPARTELEPPARRRPGRGERTLVAGPNGAGKSTWLRALARRESAGRSPGAVALVIQEPRRSLFARSVADELAFGLRRRGLSARELQSRVQELLARFDLTLLAERSPLRLSFGQQHRLAIAASLAPRPDVVLVDEPFAGLDPRARLSLLRALEQELEDRPGTAARLFVASHDRDPLARWCDRVVELDGPAPVDGRAAKGARRG